MKQNQHASSSRVELLVVAVQTVDIALRLGASTAHFKADSTLVDTLVESIEALHTDVLQRVLDTGDEVGNELVDRATVQNGARNTLSDQDAIFLGEVPRGASVAGLAAGAGLLVFHRCNAAHSSVRLDELALVADKVFTRRLGGAGEKTAHHNGGGAHCETLDDMSDVLDTAISDAGHAEASRECGDAPHRGRLGSADGHDFLRDTGAAAAHANSQAIGTGSDEGRRLLSRNDVTADDIDLGNRLLDVLDHLSLEDAVALAAVQDDDVKTSFHEQLQSGLVLFASANRGGADQLLGLGKLGCQRVVEVLHQIASRQQGHQVAVSIDNRKLALLRATENFIGFRQGGARGSGHQVSRHDGADRIIELVVELDVSRRDHSNELGTEVSIFCR